MSDYLGHLLERSFAPTPEVRPQVPSLFEPKPASEPTELRLDFTEKDRPAEENDRRRPTADRREEFAAEVTGENPGGEFAPTKKKQTRAEKPFREESAPDDVSTPAKRREADPVAPQMSRPAVFRDQPPAAPIAPLQSPLQNERPKPVTPEAELTANRDKPVTRPVAVDFHIDNSERQPGDRRPSLPFDRVQKLQPREHPSASDKANLPHAITPRFSPSPISAPSPRKNDPRKESALPAAPAIPPAINVTIGRVEIRATPPPAPVRNTARKEPGMSLETYLQRRSGGSS